MRIVFCSVLALLAIASASDAQFGAPDVDTRISKIVASISESGAAVDSRRADANEPETAGQLRHPPDSERRPHHP